MGWERPFAIKPEERAAFPPYVHYSGENALLTPEQCDAIVYDTEKRGELGWATVGNGGNDTFREDREYRCVQSSGLWPQAHNLEWLFERVADRAAWVNQDNYRFLLSGLNEGMQYLRYDAPKDSDDIPGHYDWHQDYGGGYSSHRKLSVVIQLSDPGDYDGCRLKLFTECEFDVPYIGKGEAVFFPSWQPHCVTPITRGTRRALVCWVSGPQFM